MTPTEVDDLIKQLKLLGYVVLPKARVKTFTKFASLSGLAQSTMIDPDGYLEYIDTGAARDLGLAVFQEAVTKVSAWDKYSDVEHFRYSITVILPPIQRSIKNASDHVFAGPGTDPGPDLKVCDHREHLPSE